MNNRVDCEVGSSVAFRFPPHNTIYFGKISKLNPNGSIEVKRDNKFLVMTTATIRKEDILANGQ